MGLSDIAQSGPKGLSFAVDGSINNDVPVGSKVRVRVAGDWSTVDARRKNKAGEWELDTWDNGEPKKQYVLPVTVLKDTTGQNPEGEDRAVYCSPNKHRGSMFKEIQIAEDNLRKGGFRVGDQFTIEFRGRVDGVNAKSYAVSDVTAGESPVQAAATVDPWPSDEAADEPPPF